tara:strand:+ start:330 stop:440 length:111 start_codon:yes stop_codon:yes gene_type:complete
MSLPKAIKLVDHLAYDDLIWLEDYIDKKIFQQLKEG